MSDPIFDTVLALSAVLLVAAALVAGARIVHGPTAADRVIALDMLGLLGVAAAGLAALQAQSTAFVDVALGITLVGFLATVAFAGYIARGAIPAGRTQGAAERGQ